MKILILNFQDITDKPTSIWRVMEKLRAESSELFW